jgi:hypothetical protein
MSRPILLWFERNGHVLYFMSETDYLFHLWPRLLYKTRDDENRIIICVKWKRRRSFALVTGGRER